MTKTAISLSILLHAMIVAVLFLHWQQDHLTDHIGNSDVIKTYLYRANDLIKPRQRHIKQLKPKALLTKKTQGWIQEKKRLTQSAQATAQQAKKQGQHDTLAILLHNEISTAFDNLAGQLPDYLKNKTITLTFSLTSAGRIKSLHIKKSSGNLQLDQMALNAVNTIAPVTIKLSSDHYFQLDLIA